MSPHNRTPNTIVAIACAVTASVVFSVNDMGIKFLSGDYALHQVILIRACAALVVTLAILVPLEGGYKILKTRRLGLHLVRGLIVVISNIAFFLGLASVSLPEATAIFFVAPLMIAALSVIFLGEKVGWRRWLAVNAGLLGVVIILRPGSSAFQPAALLPIAAAASYAILQITTRKMGGTEKPASMTFYVQLCFLLASGAMGIFAGDGRFGGTGNPSADFLLRAWVWPPAIDLAIMSGIGVTSAVGGYLISRAYVLAEAALVAPFEYSALAMAIFWSVLIWNEWPDAAAWTGIALIFGSSLFMFLREAATGRRLAARQPPPMPPLPPSH